MFKILFFFTVSTAQTITGVVSDNTNKPLESENAIAVPADRSSVELSNCKNRFYVKNKLKF